MNTLAPLPARTHGRFGLLHSVWVFCWLIQPWPAAQAAIASADYFYPPIPAASWTYQISGQGSGTVTRTVVSGSKTLHGVAAFGLRDARNGAVEAVKWWTTSQGVQLHRWDLDEKPIPSGFVFEQPLTYLPANLALNGTYSFTGKAATIPSDGSQPTAYPGNVQGSVQILAQESIKVPAGQFDCLKVGVAEMWTVGADIIRWSVETWWLARNVGLVKADLNGEIWELASTTVSGGSGTPPSVVSAPQGLTLPVGATATFTVAAGGTEPLSYQWLKNDNKLPGQTGTNLTLTNLTSLDAGSYSVLITNAFGAVTSPAAALQVTATTTPPRIRSWGMNAEPRFELGFDATAGGPWQVEGTSNFRDWTPLGLAAVGAGSMQFRDAVPANLARRFYRLRSSAAVIPPPVITSQPQSLTNYVGATARFAITATGAESYQWLKQNAPLKDQTNAVLLLPNVATADAGSYAVVASNSGGSVTSSIVSLTISQSQPLTLLPQPGLAYKEGTTFGGPLFGVELTIPPRWQGGLSPNTPFFLFTSQDFPGVAITSVTSFAGTKDEIMADPGFRAGFQSQMGAFGTVSFQPVDFQNPVKFTGPNRLTVEYAGPGQDFARTIMSCVVEMLVHPSGGVVAFVGFSTQDKVVTLRAQTVAFLEKAALTPRNTNLGMMAQLHGRSFNWSGSGSDWYRHEEGYYPSSTSLSSWSNSKAFFCSAGTFEITTSSETMASVTNPSTGFFGVGGTTNTRDYGQWTIVQVPGYGNILLMVTLSGYQVAPVKVGPDGTLYVASTTMSPAGTFRCQ